MRKSKKEIRYVILKSSSGLSIVDRKQNPNVPLKKFFPDKDDREKTAEILRKKGFEVVETGLTHIAIRGTKSQFQKVFAPPKLEFHPGPITAKRLVKDKSAEPEVPEDLARFVKTIGSQVPVKLLTGSSPSANPPDPGYWHLRIPDDPIKYMVTKAHSRNIKGKGIKIALVDSGFMRPYHPYFKRRGYEIKKTIAFSEDEMPKQDFKGHGTAMAACILAVAPEATLIPVKAYVGVDELFPSAFEKAILAKPKPHIISCSWGYSEDSLPSDSTIELLDALIDLAVEEGITVLFACGNHPDTVVSWPSSKPNVISVGGAYITEGDQLMASDFAVSGQSIVTRRQCPDLCGLCGIQPIAAYIALPIPPNSEYDIWLSYWGDVTLADDGWVITSGTSAATALAAGVAALWMQANPSNKRKPDKVKQGLMDSCLAIRNGQSSTGEPADRATGAGLVQAF